MEEARHGFCTPALEIVGDAASQFDEHGHVELVLVVAQREPDVATDELVEDLEVCREALEDELVLLVIDAELFGLPVYVPGSHRGVAPGLLVLHGVQVDENQTIVRNSQQLLETHTHTHTMAFGLGMSNSGT